MSKLNDLDNDLIIIPLNAQGIARAWGDRIRRLANNSRVEKDTLQLLVCCAFKLDEITEGRAAEILGLHRLDFRDLYVKWEKEYEKTLD